MMDQQLQTATIGLTFGMTVLLMFETHAWLEEQKNRMFEVRTNYCQFPQLRPPGDFVHPDQYHRKSVMGPQVGSSPAQAGASPDSGVPPEHPREDSEDEDDDWINALTESHTAGQEQIFKGSSPDDQANRFPFVVTIGKYEFPYNVFFPFNLDFDPDGQEVVRFPMTTCTGVLISDKLILTNSHCVDSWRDQFLVVGGAVCRPEMGGILELAKHGAGTAQLRRAKKFVRRWPSDRLVEPTNVWRRSLRTFYGIVENIWLPFDLKEPDLAILRLEEPFELTEEVAAIDLVESDKCQGEWQGANPVSADGEGRAAATHRRLTLAGWGLIDQAPDKKLPTRLQWFDAQHPDHGSSEELADKSQGKQFLERNDRCDGTKQETDGWICLPVAPGRSPQACKGDSGSPLIRRNAAGLPGLASSRQELIGILSSGQWSDSENDATREFRPCGQMSIIIAVRLCGGTLTWLQDKVRSLS